MRINKARCILEITQALMWACVFLLPSIIYMMCIPDFQGALWVFKIMVKLVFPTFVVYILNYCLLVPKLVYARKLILFIIANLFLLAANFFINFYHDGWINTIPEQLPEEVSKSIITAGFTGFVALVLLFQVMVTMLAIGMRYIIKWNDEKHKMEEERRRNAEAELTWLKNQLNPHFLFNTLNNISSLTQIDADKAQESIGQFSELLRYALYESNVKKVKLTDETEFMKNYINLMSLRCNEMTLVETRFDSFDESLIISPLLFISLIENAFKHGISSHKDSFVKIDMGLDGNDLVFSCENSIHERTSENRSGSGIGLENMLRRLDLLYPDAYTYRQYIEDRTYIAIVRIHKINKV